MYKCFSCGGTFQKPARKPKGAVRLVGLMFRSLWDRSITADDQFESDDNGVPVYRCPFCGSDDIGEMPR